MFRISSSRSLLSAPLYLALAVLVHSAAVAAPPPSPELFVSINGTRLYLTWNAVEGADGYKLLYAPYPSAEPVSSVDLGDSTIISEELPIGSAYYVAIQSYNEDGVDGYSNVREFDVQGGITKYPEIDFTFGGAVEPDSAALIRNSTMRTWAFFQSQGWPSFSSPLSVYGYRDHDELVAAYAFFNDTNLGSARALWSHGYGGIARPESFWVNLGSESWNVVTDSRRANIMAHELFHILQMQLGGQLIEGPLWLSEGSAEYVGTSMRRWAGIADVESELQNTQRDLAANEWASLADLETGDGFWSAYNPYGLSLLAVDFLTDDASDLVEFYSAFSDGAAWEDVFIQTFGRTVETFYEEFEAYQGQLAASYESNPSAGEDTQSGAKVSLNFGAEVSSNIEQSITDAVTGTEAYLSSLGFPFESIPVYAYENYESLLDAYASINSVDLSTADQQWQSENAVTMLGYGWSLFINLSSSNWPSNDEADQAVLLAQELYRTLQFQQRKGSLFSEGDQVPSGGPVWLREGSKNLIGYKSADWQGKLSFDSILEQSINSLSGTAFNLAEMETQSGYYSQAGSQDHIGLIASNFLSLDLVKFIEFYTAIGSGQSWQDSFTQTFGKTLETFYEEFASYQVSIGSSTSTSTATDSVTDPEPNLDDLCVSTEAEDTDSAQLRFTFGDAVNSSLRSEIQEAAFQTETFFASQSLPKFQRTAKIHAYADYEKLLEAFIAVATPCLRRSMGLGNPTSILSLSEADEALGGGAAQGQAIGNNVFINYANSFLSNSALDHRTAIVAHELFHVLQFQLVEREFFAGPNTEVPFGGPAWIVEGSAVLAEELMTDSIGLTDFSEELQRSIDWTSISNFDLEDMESYHGFLLVDEPYQFSLMAVAYLSRDLSQWASFFSSISNDMTWEEAFIQTFGKDVDTFYAEFRNVVEQL